MSYELSLEDMKAMYLRVFKEKGGSFEPNNFMVNHFKDHTMPLEDIISYLVSTHDDLDGDNYCASVSHPEESSSTFIKINYRIPGLGGPKDPLILLHYNEHEKAYRVLGLPFIYSPYANRNYALELGLFLYFYRIKVLA